MKRKLLLVALAISLSASAFAQGIIHGSGDPTTLSPVPNCNPNRFYVDDSTQDMWQSNQGSPCLWVKSSSASGSGTVTHTGGALTADKVVAGAGAADAKATDLGYVTPNLTVPAGGSVGSADTGSPKFSFAANSITANQPLTVSGSTAIVPSTAAGGDVGSATLPFQFLWFAGSSGTPGTNNFKLVGASTSGTRTINAPDANTNLPIIPQTLTFAGPTAARTYTVRDANATLATKTGSPATNDCAKFDANGELTTAGAACGSGGSSFLNEQDIQGAGTTGNAAVQTVYTYAVPAGTPGDGKCIAISSAVSSAGTGTLDIYFGLGTASVDLFTVANGTLIPFNVVICNNSASHTAQWWLFQGGSISGINSYQGTFAVDTSAGFNVLVGAKIAATGTWKGYGFSARLQ